MRCIEIFSSKAKVIIRIGINRNMRCIEIDPLETGLEEGGD